MPDRDEYYRACRRSGMTRNEAAALADGIINARRRVAQGLPGWESVVHKMPDSLHRLGRGLFGAAVISYPSDDRKRQSQAGIQAAVSFGVLVGMRLAEAGFHPSQEEREAAAKNLPELDAWILKLCEDRKLEAD